MGLTVVVVAEAPEPDCEAASVGAAVVVVNGVTVEVVADAARYAYSPAPVPDTGPTFVTTTSTVEPSVPAGTTHVSDVADTTFTDVHDWPPTVTVAPATKPVPVTVTVFPPAGTPSAGLTAVTVGVGFTYVNVPKAGPPFGLVITTCLVPTEPAGVSHVNSVPPPFTVTFVHGCPSMVTVALGSMFVPVIVSVVPPDVGPVPDPVDAAVAKADTAGPAGRMESPRRSWLLLHHPVAAENPNLNDVAVNVIVSVRVGVLGKIVGVAAAARYTDTVVGEPAVYGSTLTRTRWNSALA
jgi:hypothetical protein